jgi:general secretion pathway protein M
MSLAERIDKLEPRERRLLGVLGGLVAAVLFLVLPVYLWAKVAGKRDDNREVRDLTQQILDQRQAVAERRAKRDALRARYAKPAPPLGSFIEEAAKANGIAGVPESQDRPEVPHGKRFSERMTVVRLHKIGMKAIASTLEKIESAGFPVAVTRLDIKPRAGEQDSFEVELGVSAFDRKPDTTSSAPAPAGSASPSASPSATAAPEEP